MATDARTLQCPNCRSDHMVWRGVENDNESKSADPDRNPAALIHRWECLHCGESFKQRIE